MVVAYYNEKCIAGAIFFHFGSKAIYKFGASDTKYQHLRANNLMIWEAIKWYAENGFKSFCFSKTELENDGLRQLKNGWGIKEHVIKYFKYDLTKDCFIKANEKLTGFHNKIFGRMLINLLKLSGMLIYRPIG